MDTTTWLADHPSDNILDSIDFQEIILMLQCNERKPHTKTQVLKCYKEALEVKLQDANYILENNIDFILKEAK